VGNGISLSRMFFLPLGSRDLEGWVKLLRAGSDVIGVRAVGEVTERHTGYDLGVHGFGGTPYRIGCTPSVIENWRADLSSAS